MSLCHASCLTCTTEDFFNCTSCPSPLELYGNICQDTTIYALQIASTISLLMFIIPLLLHTRRFFVLSLLFDLTQFISHFKYFTVYERTRNYFLLLGGRGWGNWSEGWKIVNLDTGVGIWILEQGNIDKAIRILCYLGAVLVITLLIGVIKIATGQAGMTFSQFWKKNWLNSLMVALYITIQDMSFIIANKFYLRSATLSTMDPSYHIIDLILSLIFAAIIIATIISLTYVVNTMPKNNHGQFFHHANMFIFSVNGSLFQSYYSIANPPVTDKYSSPTQPKPQLSNLRIFFFLFKIVYPFVVIYTLAGNDDQLMSTAGALAFLFVVTWVYFPFKAKQEWSQMTILAIGQAATIVMLYLYGQNLMGSIAVVVIQFSFFGLGLISLLIEMFVDFYKLIPVDLYNTGLKVDIQLRDHELERERKRLEDDKKRLQEQLRQQEELNRKRLLEMSEEERLKEKLRLEQQKKLQEQIERMRRQMEEEKDQNKRKQLEQRQRQLIEKQQSTMTESQAAIKARQDELKKQIREHYRVDVSRLNPYEWDKKRKFVYSNKMSRL